MKPYVIAVCAALAAPVAPGMALSQEAGEESGTSLMEEGARLFLKGLQQQMEPAWEGLQGFAEEMGPQMRSFLVEMGPALQDLMEKVEDWSAYHPPEMLPNGDIILRRKEPKDDIGDPEAGETDI